MKISKWMIIVSAKSALFLLLYSTVFAQTDMVKSEGITSDLHRINLGKIIFTAKPVPIESLQEKDFLQTVELKQTADLSFRAFLGNSLTNYLHRLAPQLSADELARQGSYQFSFFVDGAP